MKKQEMVSALNIFLLKHHGAQTAYDLKINDGIFCSVHCKSLEMKAVPCTVVLQVSVS